MLLEVRLPCYSKLWVGSDGLDLLDIATAGFFSVLPG